MPTGATGVLLNVTPVNPTAGANAGKIDITYDAYGVAGPTTDVLIDVVGYTTSGGLQELVADVAAKANAADVYTKAPVDALTMYTSVTSTGTLVAARSNGATAVNRSSFGSYFVTFDITTCVGPQPDLTQYNGVVASCRSSATLA